MFQTHFSLFSKIIMKNVENFNYLSSIDDDVSLSFREIKQITYKTTFDKTLEQINYINKIIRMLVDDAFEQIRSLFEKCIQKKIQSTQFKSAITIILRKSNDKDYLDFKTYKLIALLDTLSKILKSIISKRFRYVVEMHNTLSNTQMKTRKHKSTNTILQLITKKIHIIWSDTKRKVVTLLSLNDEEVFNNVTHNKLLHDMKKKKILKLFLKFVKNFFKNRRTTITIDDYTTTKRSIDVSISQSFSLSSIFYLFYNANLLEICDNIKLRINFIEFVNDVNILTYEKSTKRNCKIVNEIYTKCEQWTQTHDTKFSKKKHELIHFSKISKWFNINARAKLASHQLISKTNVKILRV